MRPIHEKIKSTDASSEVPTSNTGTKQFPENLKLEVVNERLGIKNSTNTETIKPVDEQQMDSVIKFLFNFSIVHKPSTIFI